MGIRDLATAVGLAVVLVGCGSSSAPPAPTTNPSQQGVAAATEAPSITPTPAATSAPTGSLTPAGPFNAGAFLADLKAGGHALDKYKSQISPAAFRAAYDALMQSVAKPPNANFPAQFASCATATDPQDFFVTDCISVTGWGLRAIHVHPASAEAEAFGLAVARWDLTRIYTTPERLALLTQGVADAIANF